MCDITVKNMTQKKVQGLDVFTTDLGTFLLLCNNTVILFMPFMDSNLRNCTFLRTAFNFSN